MLTVAAAAAAAAVPAACVTSRPTLPSPGLRCCATPSAAAPASRCLRPMSLAGDLFQTGAGSRRVVRQTAAQALLRQASSCRPRTGLRVDLLCGRVVERQRKPFAGGQLVVPFRWVWMMISYARWSGCAILSTVAVVGAAGRLCTWFKLHSATAWWCAVSSTCSGSLPQSANAMYPGVSGCECSFDPKP
jgi:hypothetical protein